MTDNSPATDEELRTLIGKALEPFASFAQNIDKDGWVSNIHREPISNWFGPSDFRSALEALNAASRIRAETARNSGEVDEAYIDAYLDIILKASGSALRHYDFKDRLRKAMREVLSMVGGAK